MPRFEVITHEPVPDNDRFGIPKPKLEATVDIPEGGVPAQQVIEEDEKWQKDFKTRFEVINHISTDRGIPPDISPEERFQTIRNQQERIQPNPKNRDPSKFDPDSFDWGQFGLKPSLLKSVAKIESNFNPTILSQPDKIDPKTGKERPADVRAAGLMQMRRPAWIDANKWAGTDYPLSARFDPKINAKLGSVYLRKMIDKAGGDTRTGLAMYYAGEGGYRSNPKLRREGQEYANKILKQQLQFEQEDLRQRAKERLATKSNAERMGLAALEGVGSAAAALPQLAVLAADAVKWGLGHDDAFQMSQNMSRNLEIIPDEEKSLVERALSYGVSGLTLAGGPIRISKVAGGQMDEIFTNITRPFIVNNAVGGGVGALVGVTDHYSRDTLFEGWSPVFAGVGGALLLRNFGKDNVVRALEGTTKTPADVMRMELDTAMTNTPGEVVDQLTTPQIMGDPLLASLQNRVAMYDPVGSELTQLMQNQSKRLHRKGLGAFPGDQDQVLVRLQQESNELEDQIARAIGNPSRVEGEIDLRRFLDANHNKIMSKKNQLYDMAKPYPVTINIDPIEDVIEAFNNRVWQTGNEPRAVRSLREALYEHKSAIGAAAHRIRKGEPVEFHKLKKAWEDLGSEGLKYDPDAEKIREYLKDLAVDPTSNPDGWEYASAASTFHNGLLDIYEPQAVGGQRTTDTLLYREKEQPKPKPGELPPRTGISSYKDVMDIRRLSRPVHAVNSPEWVTATKEQVDKALNPVLAAQLREASVDPVSQKLQPGHAAEYIAKKKDVLDAANFESGDVFELDKRFGQVASTLGSLETKSIKEATFDVINNPRAFKDFVEVTSKYGAEGQKDFTRLAAVSLLDEMFPENLARQASRPGAKEVSGFDASDFLNSYSSKRMFDTDQRNFLIALNRARAGIEESASAGVMGKDALMAAVPNSILYNIVKGLKNTATRETSELASVMSKRDARLLAAALHDPKIARKVLNVPKSWKGTEVWYNNMEGDMADWQRRFRRDLARGGIVARKTDELMRRMGMRQYLMEEQRTDRESIEPLTKAASTSWERIGGVFQ